MVSWCAPGQTERKRRAVLVAPRDIVDRLVRVRPGLVSDLGRVIEERRNVPRTSEVRYRTVGSQRR
jgi:hypothetical protein